VISPIHRGRFLFLLALSAASGLAEVSVKVRLEQPEYLVGEPVYAVVDVTNIGTEALGYADANGRVWLTVPGGRRNQIPNLWGCYSERISGSGGAAYDPPPLAPGHTASARHLLEGYRLQSGTYVLRASGKAGVTWYFGMGHNSSAVSERKVGDPVEGAKFDVTLRLNIKDGTDAELRQSYARYVDEASVGSGFTVPSRQAREAIAEMAPPFLEKTILEFANQPETADLAVEGLGQIPTPESRADLIQLFDKSADLRLRASIVEKLAGIGTPAELAFFASLVPGHSSTLDDEIHIWAILGIGRIGGEQAVKILESLPPSPNPRVRNVLVAALGNTRSPAAVPVLIGMYADESLHDDVCGALAILTHRQWCLGFPEVTETQTKWRTWWRTHGSDLPLYGNDECAPSGTLLPLGD